MLPIANIQGFLKKCITFSWVDWLRNGESLRSGPIYMEDPVDLSNEVLNIDFGQGVTKISEVKVGG